jgi:hypothetical protein
MSHAAPLYAMPGGLRPPLLYPLLCVFSGLSSPFTRPVGRLMTRINFFP